MIAGLQELLRVSVRVLRRQLGAVWPRAKGDLNNYRNEFQASALAFRRFVARSRSLSQSRQGRPIGVVVSPWVGTPSPWYSIAIAIGLARRGRRVALIWDDTALPESPGYLALQNSAIASVTRDLASVIPTIALSSVAARTLNTEDERTVSRLAVLIMIWRLRARPMSTEDSAEVTRMAGIMTETLGRIKGLVAETEFAYLVVPGGIYASSGLFLWAAEQAKVRASTIDANIGVVQVSTYGIAAQQSDIPTAFAEAVRWDSTIRQRAIQEARRHFGQRLAAADSARYQITRPTGAFDLLGIQEPFVLVALNIEHDAGALGLHAVFVDSMDWVLAVTELILKESPTTTVVVRQHPAERRPNERSRFPIRSVLTEHFGDEPRLRFIAAEDSVNTYELVEQARLVLPYVSTIGIEAAALGKPVLVAGESYYSRLGFVWQASSREHYCDLLRRGLKSELGLLPDQVDKAWLCYYLTPVCNRIWTDFSPQPPDFWKWQKRSPDDLYAEPAVADILTTFDENVPAALVRHRRFAHS